MMSLGLATEAQFAQMMEEVDFDMTVITVQRNWGRPGPGGMWEIPEDVPDLNSDAVDAFDQISGVVVASPIIWGSIYMRSGPYAAQAWDVIGIRPAALPLMGYTLAYGSFLEEDGSFSAVFGALAELTFYLPASNHERRWDLWNMDLDNIDHFVDVLNDPIQLSYDSRLAPPAWTSRFPGEDEDDDMFDDIADFFRPLTRIDLNVVGVLERTADVWDDMRIYMDIEVLEELNWMRMEAQMSQMQEDWGFFSPIRPERERTAYDSVFVRVASVNDTHRVATEIEEMGFSTHYPGEWIDTQRRQQENIRVLLIAIAAISLLVATINIANTMITSVTERTKEIGVMKVIGAAIKDVRRLFLLEAVMIGIIGGILGIGLSLIGSYVMNNFDIPFLEGLGPPDMSNMWGMPAAAENPVVSLITPWLLLLALGVAAGVGLIAGYFPARRATKLSALAAIRAD